jgi:glycosyltransferase involved in cell wall biosynthesis
MNSRTGSQETASGTPVKISVVVCARNESARIADALEGILLNSPDEIIVVDDDSSDATVEIARRYTANVILAKTASLTRNRQIGIDKARNELVAMIDADHILRAGDLDNMFKDLCKYQFDVVQGQLISYANAGFWNRAEEESWNLTHNIPGPMSMIASAPTLYRKRVFESVRFDGTITEKMDDTDFAYRLARDGRFRFGVGETQIRHLHFAGLSTYLRKFIWYGYGDGEFAHKHPRRAHSIFFHQLIRYPFLYPAKAIFHGQLRAVPFFVLQGLVRFAGLCRYLGVRRNTPRAQHLRGADKGQ